MTEREGELARAVEAAVRAVPGVRSLYRTRSLAANLLDEGAIAWGLAPADAPVAVVRMTAEGAAVTASVGIDDEAPAAVTVRAARLAADAVLTAAGVRVASIEVTVAYVHPREAGASPW